MSEKSKPSEPEVDPAEGTSDQEKSTNFWGFKNAASEAKPDGSAPVKHKPGAIVDPGKFSFKEDLQISFNLGSTAGAGSGDFHTYRKVASKVKEREEKLEKQWAEEELQEAFEAKVKQQNEELAAQAAKRAEKRKRKKEAQAEAKRKGKLEKLLPAANDGTFFEKVQATLAAQAAQEADKGSETNADK